MKAINLRHLAQESNVRIYEHGSGVALDADGNLTSGPLTNGIFVSQTFDARNRLVSSGGVTNFYDAANNRIGQIQGTNVTSFVVNPNAKLPQVLMRIKNGVTNYYIYGAGLLYQITETATATNTLTYHYDYRGSTIALTDGNGLVTDRIEYSAYGLMTYRTGNTDTPFLFNGRYGVQTEPNGLLYMRARYYNPYLCRFLNPDPSGFSGGLNFYAYANGNPISYLDASGFNAAATGDTFFTWLMGWGAPPLNLQDPFGVGAIRERSSPEQQAVNAMRLVTAGIDFNPNMYQPTEPSTFAIFSLGLSFFGGELALARSASTENVVNQTAENTTFLYQKVGASGEHLKFGITGNPATRYTAAELNGGQLRIIAQGERSEMLGLERSLHESLPIGPEEGQLFYIQKQIQNGLIPPPSIIN